MASCVWGRRSWSGFSLRRIASGACLALALAGLAAERAGADEIPFVAANVRGAGHVVGGMGGPAGCFDLWADSEVGTGQFCVCGPGFEAQGVFAAGEFAVLYDGGTVVGRSFDGLAHARLNGYPVLALVTTWDLSGDDSFGGDVFYVQFLGLGEFGGYTDPADSVEITFQDDTFKKAQDELGEKAKNAEENAQRDADRAAEDETNAKTPEARDEARKRKERAERRRDAARSAGEKAKNAKNQQDLEEAQRALDRATARDRLKGQGWTDQKLNDLLDELEGYGNDRARENAYLRQATRKLVKPGDEVTPALQQKVQQMARDLKDLYEGEGKK